MDVAAGKHRGRTLIVKVKFGDFEQITRSRSVSEWLEDQTRAKVRRSIERLAQIEDDLGRG